METHLRVFLLLTAAGTITTVQGCSNGNRNYFNETEPGYCSDNFTKSEGKCWGRQNYVNTSIECADNLTDPKTLSWCGRNMSGFPFCAEWKQRERVKCLSEIYEKCKCITDDLGRPECYCHRFMFWRVYPFIYILLGLSMVVIYVVCHVMKLCGVNSDEEEEEEEEDLTKPPKYTQQGEI